jgi:cephalosporin hydroxylase
MIDLRGQRLLKGWKLLVKNPLSFWRYFCRGLFPTPSPYRKRFEMTLKQWLLYQEKHVGYKKPRWMGVQIVKGPLDAWIYQELIFDVQPDVIIEIGSYKGGSTLFFANLLDLIGKGIIVSIDIDRSEYKVKHPRIREITGDSGSPEVVRRVREVCQGKRVLVSHDGSHHKNHVLADLRNYSPLVPLGSYFVVEDSVYDMFSPIEGLGGFADGSLDAIEAFLKENPCFEPDAECERYIFTYNPRGFLKRVR